jgi:hypothetical protein
MAGGGSVPPRVFLVTHTRREPWERPGGTTFHVVNDGIESALNRAREAAGDRDVRIAGAETIQEYLDSGLIDEFSITPRARTSRRPPVRPRGPGPPREAVHLQTCRPLHLRRPPPWRAVRASRGRSQRAGFVTMRKTMTITSIARIAPTTVPRVDACLNSSDVGPASSYARICARSAGE